MNLSAKWLATTLLVASLAAAAGCGQRDGSIQPEATPSASVAAVDAPPAPSPSAPAPPAPVVPVPMRLSAERLALQIMEKKDHGYQASFRIFPAGDRMIVGPDLRVLANGRLVDTPWAKDVQLTGEDLSGGASDKGLDEVTLLGVVGAYPDDLWLDVEAGWGYAVARSNQGTWVERRYSYLRQFGKFGRVKDWPVGASPWSKRRTLAYLGEGRFRLALGNKKNPDPLPKQAAGASCPVRIDGKGMMALPSGHVAVAGPDCDAGGALALERWGTGADEASLSKSEIVPLPGAPADKPTFVRVLLRDDVAYVVAAYESRSYIAEIRDGRAVEIEPPTARLAAAHLAADGTLFVAANDALYRLDGVRDGQATYSPASLPGGARIKKQHGLFGASREHVYWAVELEKGALLLSSAPPPPDSPPEAPSAATAASPTSTPVASSAGAEPAASAAAPEAAGATAAPASTTASVSAGALLDTLPPLTAECTTPLLVLFPVASSTPKDFDFASVKADLADFSSRADVQLVDFEYKGERFLAAVVKDERMATALAAHLATKRKDPAPKPTCLPVPSTARRLQSG